MRPRFNLLTMASGISIGLLLLGALLVVLGIFNAFLEWDIFSPKVEKILYGVFWSCVALAAFGVCTTFVVGIRDAVRSFQSSRGLVGSQTENDRKSSSFGQYLKAVGMLSLLLVFLVGTLSFANHRILLHRTAVYKKLIGKQMEQFGPKLAPLVEALSEPPRSNVPEKIHALIKSLDNMTIVSRTTLYLPDPEDESSMWGYTCWRAYQKKDGFARFFVAKDFEVAMAQSLHGPSDAIDGFNKKNEFLWFHLVRGSNGTPIAVVRADGNKNENFREYSL